MALQDFATYVEVDPNSHITVTKNRVDQEMHEDEDAYVYKDFGVGHFGDFEHRLTAQYNTVEEYSYFWFHVLTNDIDDMKGLLDGGKAFLGIFFWDNAYLVLEYFDGTTRYQDGYAPPFPFIPFETPFYFTIRRSGSTYECEMYDDAARTSLVVALSLEGVTTNTFRYLMASNTYNLGVDITGDYLYVDNLDLEAYRANLGASGANVGDRGDLALVVVA